MSKEIGEDLEELGIEVRDKKLGKKLGILIHQTQN